MLTTRTQRYIKGYCKDIDSLLELWKTPGTNEAIDAIAGRVKFFHHILGIPQENNWFIGEIINPNISRYYIDLDEFSRDPSYCKRTQEQIELRNQHVKDCKKIALAIKEPIEKLEIRSRPKEKRTKDRIGTLKKALEQMNYLLESGSISQEYETHGKIANNLAVELGMVSQFRELAIKTYFIKNTDRFPHTYDSNNSFITNVVYENVFDIHKRSKSEIDRLKKKVSYWLDKVNELEPQDYKPVLTPEVEPIRINEEQLLAFDGVYWQEITPAMLHIIKLLNSKPGLGFNGEELKTCPGSQERPDKTIKRMPKSIQKRIKNRNGLGYRLVN